MTLCPIPRRKFLQGLAGGFVSAWALGKPAHLLARPFLNNSSCWVNLCVPFFSADRSGQWESEIILTGNGFPGVRGYTDEGNETEYELQVYSASGEKVTKERTWQRLVPPMQPTVVSVHDLLPNGDSFGGGLRLRVRPRGPGLDHLGDMFSTAFARWRQGDHSTYVHAHPDPVEFLNGRFSYSIPFPRLAEFDCHLALFNPNDETSDGTLTIYDRAATKARKFPYQLEPHGSKLFDLSALKFMEGPQLPAVKEAVAPGDILAGGVVAVENKTPSAKVFGNLFMRGRESRTFAVEHPLHQGLEQTMAARPSPYKEGGSFAAESLLFTPLVFSGFKVAGLELDSQFCFSAGRGWEEALWLMPFVTLPNGDIAWSADRDPELASRIEPALTSHKVIRLNTYQSCVFHPGRLPLPEGFAGGLGLASVPATHHTLMKPEVVVRGWNKTSFTHFRPGGSTSRRYRNAPTRGGVATDYIVSGVRVAGTTEKRNQDCLLAIMNIEFTRETEANSEIEVFGQDGLLARRALGRIPALACRHRLLSELIPELNSHEVLSVRLVDPEAMMIMSAIHLDFDRQDISIDHGSDRHSTYDNYGCKSTNKNYG